MNRNLPLALALAAGLLGGTLSRYITLPSVHAQAPAVTPPEIRAQRFTLVDSRGAVMGTFTSRDSVPSDPGRRPARIVLLDRSGREIWAAGGIGIQPVAAP
jgi:hypothetical protein